MQQLVAGIIPVQRGTRSQRHPSRGGLSQRVPLVVAKVVSLTVLNVELLSL